MGFGGWGGGGILLSFNIVPVPISNADTVYVNNMGLGKR